MPKKTRDPNANNNVFNLGFQEKIETNPLTNLIKKLPLSPEKKMIIRDIKAKIPEKIPCLFNLKQDIATNVQNIGNETLER